MTTTSPYPCVEYVTFHRNNNDLNSNNLKEFDPYKVENVPNSEKKKITFTEDEKFAVEDFLQDNGFKVSQEANGRSSIVVHENQLEHMLNRIHYALCSYYNFEMWFNILEELQIELPGSKVAGAYKPVFPAKLVPLHEDELKTLNAIYLQNHFKTPTKFSVSDLKNLKNRIASKMEPGKRYFVRLSSRSPKDSLFKTEQEPVATTSTPETNLSRITHNNRQLKVDSAEKIVELLVNSERTGVDISAFIKFKGKFDSLSLVLKDWVDDFPYDFEFRCFVYNRQVTAISQYYWHETFESLQNAELMEQIRKSIVAFNNSIKDYVMYNNYVLDVLFDKETGRLHIIEFNPFGPFNSSGSALFNWKRDFDILHGKTSSQPILRVCKHIVEE